MDVDKAIKEKRSIAHFRKKSVSWEKINEILESVIYAPSSGNLQNWRLIVIKNKGKLNEACLNQDPVCSCDFLVAVCSDDEELKRYYKEKSELFSIQNTAAGIQNMCLKACSMGIGSCWIGSFDKEKIKEILRIPKKIEIHAIIAFGYSNENTKSARRSSLRRIVDFEEYGNKIKESFPLIKKTRGEK